MMIIHQYYVSAASIISFCSPGPSIATYFRFSTVKTLRVIGKVLIHPTNIIKALTYF